MISATNILLVDTLEYLAGGQVASALLGNILQIKPI
jgi:hypothetical protein